MEKVFQKKRCSMLQIHTSPRKKTTLNILALDYISANCFVSITAVISNSKASIAEQRQLPFLEVRLVDKKLNILFYTLHVNTWRVFFSLWRKEFSI